MVLPKNILNKYFKIKYFRNFVLPFLYLDSILNTFKKKMTLIADGILKIRTPKNVFSWMSKKYRFRGPFEK